MTVELALKVYGLGLDVHDLGLVNITVMTWHQCKRH